jgi:hypothetical protein
MNKLIFILFLIPQLLIGQDSITKHQIPDFLGTKSINDSTLWICFCFNKEGTQIKQEEVGTNQVDKCKIIIKKGNINSYNTNYDNFIDSNYDYSINGEYIKEDNLRWIKSLGKANELVKVTKEVVYIDSLYVENINTGDFDLLITEYLKTK